MILSNPFLIPKVKTLPQNGFTLVELLTVVSIIAILALLALPNISSLVSEKDLDRAINDISLTLTQARAYAVGHQTYVFVGLEETSVANSVTSPQTPVTFPAVGGRIFMGVVATKDGTSGSNPFQVGSSTWTSYGTGNGLILIQKPKFFNNVHLVPLDQLPATTSTAMTRPTATSFISDTSGPASSTSFSLPLGTSLGAGSYNFQMVIQFDPQGAATMSGNLASWLEIDLEPTHGTSLSTKISNYAAIQIEGTTGTVRVYRP